MISALSAVLLAAFVLAIAPHSKAQLPALPIPPLLKGQGLNDVSSTVDNQLNKILGNAFSQVSVTSASLAESDSLTNHILKSSYRP